MKYNFLFVLFNLLLNRYRFSMVLDVPGKNEKLGKYYRINRVLPFLFICLPVSVSIYFRNHT